MTRFFKENYLSIDNTNSVKGLLAVSVVIYHARNFMVSLNNTVIGSILTAVGYLAVAVFFFFSGYGLTTQFTKKGKDYLKGFFKKRVLSTYFIMVFAVLLYALFDYFVWNSNDIYSVLRSLFYGKTILAYGWFFHSIVLLYVLFFVFANCERENLSFKIISGIVIYVVINFLFASNVLLYCSSILGFPAGIIIAKEKEWFDSICKKHYCVLATIVFLLFCVTLLIGNWYYDGILKVFAKCISSMFFVIFVVMLMQTIPVNNVVSRFLGKYYMEIYLAQEMPMVLFRKGFLAIQNDFIYMITVVVVTVLLALLLKPIIRLFLRMIRLS